jgi:hypothetical protein
MEQTLDDADILNSEETVNPENDEPKEFGLPQDPIEVEPKDEDVEDAEALKQRNQELYEQLKKAKGFIRGKDGKWVKKETHQVIQKEKELPGDITKTELYSLVKADVPEEDTQEVITYARSRGLTVTDALKTVEVKAILKVRDEYRKSEEVANTKSSRYGVKTPSGEAILDRAIATDSYPVEDDVDLIIKADLEQRKRKAGIS